MEKELSALEEGKVNPSEMFRAEYSQFDENGIPTHTTDGKEIAKNAIKNLKKAHEAQQKKYRNYTEQLLKDPAIITRKKLELQELKNQLLDITR